MSTLLTKPEPSPASASLVTATHDPSSESSSNTHPPSKDGPIASFKSRLSLPMQKITSMKRFASFKRKSEVQFPPQDWEVNAEGLPEVKAKSEPSTPAAESEDSLQRQNKSQPQTPAVDEVNHRIPEADAEPTYLARKIRSLIDALPSVSMLPNSISTPVAIDSDTESPPRPPTPAGSLLDAKLKALLSSEAVMNGSLGRGAQSVWSALDSLRRGGKKSEESKEDEEEEGVMMYAPLIPTPDSEIELADSELVSDETSEPDSKTSKGKGKAKTPKEHLEYIPSRTKISLQATWWGYRLYLPPPVLSILDNQTIVTAKRAALLTTSLKWLLDKVPVLMVPPPARPALMAVKRLTPYLGYVGTFIAWSWGSIKKHDEGFGVVLTATWLLPVGLIPSTWKPTEAQKSAAEAEEAIQADTAASENLKSRQGAVKPTDDSKKTKERK